MGASFEAITLDVNHRAAVAIAQLAKRRVQVVCVRLKLQYCMGSPRAQNRGPGQSPHCVRKIQGEGQSKISQLWLKQFAVTCLRFATACGMSERLRLDLV